MRSLLPHRAASGARCSPFPESRAHQLQGLRAQCPRGARGSFPDLPYTSVSPFLTSRPLQVHVQLPEMARERSAPCHFPGSDDILTARVSVTSRISTSVQSRHGSSHLHMGGPHVLSRPPCLLPLESTHLCSVAVTLL